MQQYQPDGHQATDGPVQAAIRASAAIWVGHAAHGRTARETRSNALIRSAPPSHSINRNAASRIALNARPPRPGISFCVLNTAATPHAFFGLRYRNDV